MLIKSMPWQLFDDCDSDDCMDVDVYYKCNDHCYDRRMICSFDNGLLFAALLCPSKEAQNYGDESRRQIAG